MKAPILAPRPDVAAVAATPLSTTMPTSTTAAATAAKETAAIAAVSSTTHTDAEWSAAYPEIERLYVRERRKLRHVMQYMEKEHNFAATVQMYKKRFAKWGFQKNARRKRVAPATGSAYGMSGGRKKVMPGLEHSDIDVSVYLSVARGPTLGPQDTLLLLLLTSVKTWSVSFFERPMPHVAYLQGHGPSSPMYSSTPLSSWTAKRMEEEGPVMGVIEAPEDFFSEPFAASSSSSTSSTGTSSSSSSPPSASMPPRPRPAKVKEISFAFKLVIDLLERGRGDLAGRMARKAFLLVEDMLENLAAPALVWNLLEIMHHMVSVNQVRLFHMLLAHVIALVNNQPHLAGNHPLLALLHSLRGVVSSAEASSSTAGDSKLQNLLAQAWTLNAEILFSNFHPNLFHLYCCILWESCSIGPPAALVGSVGQWFRTIDAVQMSGNRITLPTEISVPSQALPQQPPADYARLHASSLAALRAYGDAILRDGGSGFQGDTALLLRMLAGLTTAKILQGMPDTTSVVVDFAGRPDENWELANMPRIHLGNVACVIRTLVDIDAAKRGVPPPKAPPADISPEAQAAAAYHDMSFVEQVRAVVDLRTQSDGATDPQVIQEMWLLQDALGAAGDPAEAKRVEKDTYARIEQYVDDIPVDAV